MLAALLLFVLAVGPAAAQSPPSPADPPVTPVAAAAAGADAAPATEAAGDADTADPAIKAGAEPASDALPVAVTDQTLAQFRWINRLVVVFADTPRDPSFARQTDLLKQRPAALADSDVRVLTDTDPSANSAIRQALRPRGFAVVIVDKDGSIIQRKPTPWNVREITRAIEKTPLRQQELRDARDAERSQLGLPPE